MIALDDALRLLANVDAQQTQIVDMRFFTGPTIVSEKGEAVPRGVDGGGLGAPTLLFSSEQADRLV